MAKRNADSTTSAGRGFVPPTLLELPQRIKDFRRLDFRDRPLAKLCVGEIKEVMLRFSKKRAELMSRNHWLTCASRYAAMGVAFARRRPKMVVEGAMGVAGIGLAGGALAEVLHWWNLRQDTLMPAYARSSMYWIITLAMILAGGFITWVYFGQRAEAIIALHVGISTPLILQKLAISVPSTEGSRSIIATPQASIRRFFSW